MALTGNFIKVFSLRFGKFRHERKTALRSKSCSEIAGTPYVRTAADIALLASPSLYEEHCEEVPSFMLVFETL